jgi:glutamine amidotransferase
VITIVDYGLGNRGSILNVMRRVGIDGRISADAAEIAAAERLILPGVGAFDAGMANLAERGLVEPLRHAVLDRRIPILGICLGMQLLVDGSSEGKLPGLGFVKGQCLRFDPAQSAAPIKVPHMGWSELEVSKPSELWQNMTAPRFYFVHSYYVVCEQTGTVSANAKYGTTFAAAFEQENIYGVQFHPEKSHRFGMRLIENFAKVPCEPA